MTDPDPAREAFLAHHRAHARHAAPPRCFDERELAKSDRRAAVRQHVAVVSLGNRAEAHSAALAPDIDDRIGAHVAVSVANATGARYLGHVPFATDRLGGVARWWSPACEPVADFVEHTTAFLALLLAGASPSVLWLISGHGGNGAIEPHLATLAARLGVARCCYALALQVPPSCTGVDLQHAGDLEHGVAAALGDGCFDRDELDRINRDLASDLEATIKHEPALGGMAGYYLYGDERFDGLRARYPGVKRAVAELVERRRVVADPELGHAVLAHTIASLARDVLDSVAPSGAVAR